MSTPSSGPARSSWTRAATPLFICTAEWHLADDHVDNLERLATGPRTGNILALPVEVPGAGRP